MLLNYINDPSNYKQTRKKKYSVYVCMPPIGTKVFNKLEQASYVTNHNQRFVISGTVGERWVVDIGKLCKTYQLLDGRPITEAELVSKLRLVNRNGEIKPYNQILSDEQLNRYKIKQIMDWFKVETRPDATPNWALFTPIAKFSTFPINTAWGSTLVVNSPSSSHGILRGDFLITADAGGAPNLQDRWVVNGAIFPATYDMRSFKELAGGSTIATDTPKPPSLIKNK